MARLYWNFALRHWWNQPSTLVCIIAMAGCTHGLWWRNDLLQQRKNLVERAREADRTINTRKSRLAHPLPPALGNIFEEMHDPWNAMLESLQHATRPGVDLLELEPEPGDVRRIRIQGSANASQDVFDLLVALQKDPSWSSVQLVSQTRTQDANVPRISATLNSPLPTALSRSIAFSLIAQWNRS